MIAAATETISDALNRLSEKGYRDDFRAEDDQLRAIRAGCIHPPESMIIDEVVRFEGITDPDDEAIVFGLRCEPHGTKGTYVAAYGPAMASHDAEIIRRLKAPPK